VRVLVAQNYSLHEIDRACSEGTNPRHHLWGADALRRAGHEVVTLGSPERGVLHRLSRLSRFQLGDLDRQALLRRTARLNAVDVIVCAETRFVRALAVLRRVGAVRTPLVGLLHPYEARGRSAQCAVRGFDRLLSLSREATRRNPARSTVTSWGPDLGFRGYRPSSGASFVTTGQTHRDHPMLEGAARDAGVPLTVRSGRMPYERLLTDLCSALAVAIPLSRTDGCFGITELNDALALGKPILMTRNPYIDVDIEAVGCGRWIEPGDAPAWRDALAGLAKNPDDAAEMGARGRAYAAEHWNYQLFGDSLTAAVAEAAGSTP
jgi:hypothetical protein